MRKIRKSKADFQATKTYQPHLQPVDKPKKHHIKRAVHWIKTHKKISIPAAVVLVLLVGGGLWLGLTHGAPQPLVTQAKKKTVTPPTKYYSPLTGAEVTQEDTKRPVTAVMIENSPDARPQSGLKDGGVIFESVAEGGITRFLMLYQEAKPELIGPVRSVRTQFASWAAAFDAGVAHVGGPPEPVNKLRSGQIKDLDQFFNANSFYRANDRAAPHNVYTTDAKLQALNKAKGYSSSTFTSWPRNKTGKPAATPAASAITIPVSTGYYIVNYNWDKATNTYPRKEGGVAHTDREKGQLAPSVVIAIQVPHDVIDGGNNDLYPDVVGSGKAWLFQDGNVQEMHWSKSSDKAQIKFTDTAGVEVKFNPGQTWITGIKPDVTPTWQ